MITNEANRAKAIKRLAKAIKTVRQASDEVQNMVDAYGIDPFFIERAAELDGARRMDKALEYAERILRSQKVIE